MRPRRQLVLMGRWPGPGRCKRRLAQGIGPQRAAAVQKRLLEHGLAAACQAAREGGLQGVPLEVVLALDGVGPRAGRRCQILLRADRVVLQGTGDLGLRLQRQVVRAKREGIRQLVIVGTDLPHLCSHDLLEAFASLPPDGMVLGPAMDGGYWLIGLWPANAPSRLFVGAKRAIPWGGAAVLTSTLEAAAAVGITPALLPYRMDLDQVSDLAAWR